MKKNKTLRYYNRLLEMLEAEKDKKKDIVAEEIPAKKNFESLLNEKPSNAKAFGKPNCESNYWNILLDKLVKKYCFVYTFFFINNQKFKQSPRKSLIC